MQAGESFDKIKKLIVVAFLTLLIWAYAYLSLEETVQRTGTLQIQCSRPDLLVTVVDRVEPIRLDLLLKGQASAVAEFKKRWHLPTGDPQKERLDFYFDPVDEGLASPGTYTVNVLEFLRESERLRLQGLTVESCSVETVEVRVEKLVEKNLVVQCRDTQGQPITHETIDPAQVRMNVLETYTGPAIVTLTDYQIAQARRTAQRVKPYVQFGTRRIEAADPVSVSLPSAEQALKVRPFQPSRIGVLISPDLQGRFVVRLLNADELRTSTSFRATDAAMEAYDKQLYHVYVVVRDDDVNADPQEGVSRAVVYNFPPEFITKDEIQLNQDPRVARFTLVPLASAASGTGG